MKKKIPFINIAGGTCQYYASNGNEFLACNKCSTYIKTYQKLLTINTVRDRLSQKILKSLGLEVPLIPCTSIFAADNLNIKAEPPRYVCLNYMPGGGHYNFAKDVDSDKWYKTFKEFYEQIKNQHECVFVCHNNAEVSAAKKIDPKARRLYSNNYIDYLKFYAKAKIGIMNRVHGAFAIASFGRPSFVMGTDTRARMAEEIGLEHAFVPDVTTERLIKEFNTLLTSKELYQETFNRIKEKAYADYMHVFSRLKDCEKINEKEN